MNKKFLFIFAILCLGFGNVYAEELPKINVVKPFSHTVNQSFKLYGSVVPRESVSVMSSLVNQQIQKILVDVGDEVKEGDTLAIIEDVNINSTLHQTQASLDVALANQKEAQKLFNRAQNLIKKEAISVQEFESAENKLALANAQVAQMKALLVDSKHQSAKTVLKAPASGVITEKKANVGDLISNEALFFIAKNNEREVELLANISEISSIKVGDKVLVLIPENAPISGSIRIISPNMDPKTRQTKVRVSLDKHYAIPFGMQISAQILLKPMDIKMAVPFSAVKFENGIASVMIYDANKGQVVEQNVKVGVDEDGVWEILSGLTGDEMVVQKVPTFLNDGDEIEPILVSN